MHTRGHTEFMWIIVIENETKERKTCSMSYCGFGIYRNEALAITEQTGLTIYERMEIKQMCECTFVFLGVSLGSLV